MPHYVIDIYAGHGVEAGPDIEFVGRRREAIAATKREAKRRWNGIVQVRPADDDIISFGPAGADGYGTDQYATLRTPEARELAKAWEGISPDA